MKTFPLKLTRDTVRMRNTLRATIFFVFLQVISRLYYYILDYICFFLYVDKLDIFYRIFFFLMHHLYLDWNLAEIHAKSRDTGPAEKGMKGGVCECCGFLVNRTVLPLDCDRKELKFMGSGFPLFYNFIFYCLLMLVTVFVIAGGYNIYTSYQGTFCSVPDTFGLNPTKPE